MNKNDLNSHKEFWGYLYGSPYINTPNGNEKDELVKIKLSECRVCPDGLIYIWGWPGPDYNFYKYEDYGITWGFDKKDIQNLTEKEWLFYKQAK